MQQIAHRDSRMRMGIFLLLGMITLQIAIAMIYIGMAFASHGCKFATCYPLQFLGKGLWPLHIIILPINVILLGLSLSFARRWPQSMLVWMIPYFTCFTLPLGILSLVWIL